MPVFWCQILKVVHPETFSARLCATVYLRTDLATEHAFFARGRGCDEFPLHPLRTGACGSKRQSSELGAPKLISFNVRVFGSIFFRFVLLVPSA